MLTNIKGVIFDLDGTLVDSMWMWRDIDIEFLGRYNIELPEDLQTSIEGMSFSETAVYFKNRFQLTETLEEIKAIWNQMAEDKYRNQVLLKNGVVEFLTHLNKLNIPMGIATSNSKELVDIIVDKYGIKKYVRSVRTSCEVEKGKPSPDIYLLVANDLGVSPAECLVFEDVLQGINGGLSANMKVCAVEDEFSMKDIESKKELANYYIKDYFDILKKKLRK